MTARGTFSEIMICRISTIHTFPNHPFKVLDDDKMETLVDSIRENGILNPVIVRPDQTGNYEMISGHRRLHAAGIVGLVKIPAIVKEMENAFYSGKNGNPDMRGQEVKNNTVKVPDGVDPELLMKVLSNPDMAVLLTSHAKTMNTNNIEKTEPK